MQTVVQATFLDNVDNKEYLSDRSAGAGNILVKAIPTKGLMYRHGPLLEPDFVHIGNTPG